MNDYKAHWINILTNDGTQNVDFITSIDEAGINLFLEKHHSVDNKVYKKEFKKAFNTQTDVREFKLNLELSKLIQVQIPPFLNPSINEQFVDTSNWLKLESNHQGPELRTESSNLQIYCKEIIIKIEWPKYAGGGNWSFKLNPFDAYAEAEIQLNHDSDGYFVTIIPKLLKFDIPRVDLLKEDIIKKMQSAPKEILAEFNECQDKFTDLFIIAANIAATEQTPKLVRNIQIPTPVIADKPVIPALLDLSNNILTMGFGLDKEELERENAKLISKSIHDLESALNDDLKKNGGILKLTASNYNDQKNFEDLEFLDEDEVVKKLTNTTTYINSIEQELRTF